MWRNPYRRHDPRRPGESDLRFIYRIADGALSAFDQDQKAGACNQMTEYQVVVALTALIDVVRVAGVAADHPLFMPFSEVKCD
jgi:hypothetical protein